jgi:hypothetical protein
MVAMPNIVRQKGIGQQEPVFEATFQAFMPAKSV